MATSSCLSQILILCCLATALLVLQSPRAAAASGSHDQRLLGWAPTRSGCHGTIAECLAADDQDESDSEIGSRRILSTYVYISYGALQRNTVPCSQRGASYYNCYGNGAQANPYTRGCTAITRCRR